MQYKTIILELLQQRPQIHEQLRRERKLLTTLEFYAKELKDSHEDSMEQLHQLRPGSEASQISSEAMEMALKEMEDRLPLEITAQNDWLLRLWRMFMTGVRRILRLPEYSRSGS